jgi:lipopolysaccharide export system permease protein
VSRFSSTLSLYLARHFATAFLVVLGVIVGLVMLFDTIELLRRTIAVEDAGLKVVLTMVFLKMPHTMQDTLPFIVMVAMMFALFRLARSSELVVMRSAGISVWQVLGPPLAVVGLLGLINLAVLNPIAAGMYDTYQRMEDALLHQAQTSLNVGEGGLWLREADGDTAAVVHAQHLQHERDGSLRLSQISIFEIDGRERLRRRLEAKDGMLVRGFIKLDSVWEMAPGKTSVFHDHFDVPTRITLQKIEDSFESPETMSVWDLPRFIRFQVNSGFSALPHRLYWQSLLASPFMLLAMVLVASAFYLSSTMRGTAWLMRGVAGLATGFLFYFFSRFAYALGLSSTLPLFLAAWAPTVVASLLGLAYLLHREDG